MNKQDLNLNDVAYFDRTAVSSILQENIDSSFEKELIQIFVSRSSELIQSAKDSIETGDIKSIESCFHNIGGSAYHIGARRIEKICNYFEDQDSIPILDINRLILELETELKRFINSTRKVYRSRGKG